MKPKFKIMVYKISSKVFNLKLEGWNFLNKEFDTLEAAHHEILNIITKKDISISNLKIIQDFPFKVFITADEKLCTEAVGEVYCDNCGECKDDLDDEEDCMHDILIAEDTLGYDNLCSFDKKPTAKAPKNRCDKSDNCAARNLHCLDCDNYSEYKEDLGPCAKCKRKSCDGCEHDADPEQLKELDEIDIDLINDGIDDVDG